jgi:hypothetical protein
MRFLLIPFLVFLVSFAVVRTSNRWSTLDNWRRIGLELLVGSLAFVLTAVIIGIIVVFFN